MTRHYGDPALFTPARRRMARVPHGGLLVDNPVSVAPDVQAFRHRFRGLHFLA